MTPIVNGRLALEQVESGDLGGGGLVADVPFALPDQLTGLELSVAKSPSSCGRSISGVLKRDNEDAGVTRLPYRRHDRRQIAGHEPNTLGAGGDELLDRSHFAIVLSVEFAGVGLRRQASCLAFASNPSCASTKNGLVLVFVTTPTRVAEYERVLSTTARGQGRSPDGRERSRKLGHRFPPGTVRYGDIDLRPQVAGRNVFAFP